METESISPWTWEHSSWEYSWIFSMLGFLSLVLRRNQRIFRYKPFLDRSTYVCHSFIHLSLFTIVFLFFALEVNRNLSLPGEDSNVGVPELRRPLIFCYVTVPETGRDFFKAISLLVST